VSPEVVAGVLGGLLGSAGALIATWTDRRAQSAAADRLAVEERVWQLQSGVSRLAVSAHEIRRTVTSGVLGGPSKGASADTARWLAGYGADLLEPFSFIKARGSAYPGVYAAADELMTQGSCIAQEATHPEKGDGSFTEVQQQLERIVSELNRVVPAELGRSRRGRRAQRRRNAQS
jgi:hypothetical protein